MRPNNAANRSPLPPLVYQVAAYGMLLGIVAGGTGRFLPLFANEVVGLSIERAGLVLAVSGLFGIGCRIVWGRLSESRFVPVQSLWFIGIGAIGSMALLASAESLGEWSLWLFAFTSAASISAWNAVGMLAVIKGVPTNLSGRASGIVLAGFLGGLTIASPVVGWSVDTFGSYQPAWITLGLIAALGAAVVAPAVTARLGRNGEVR